MDPALVALLASLAGGQQQQQQQQNPMTLPNFGFLNGSSNTVSAEALLALFSQQANTAAALAGLHSGSAAALPRCVGNGSGLGAAAEVSILANQEGHIVFGGEAPRARRCFCARFCLAWQYIGLLRRRNGGALRFRGRKNVFLEREGFFDAFFYFFQKSPRKKLTPFPPLPRSPLRKISAARLSCPLDARSPRRIRATAISPPRETEEVLERTRQQLLLPRQQRWGPARPPKTQTARRRPSLEGAACEAPLPPPPPPQQQPRTTPQWPP